MKKLRDILKESTEASDTIDAHNLNIKKQDDATQDLHDHLADHYGYHKTHGDYDHEHRALKEYTDDSSQINSDLWENHLHGEKHEMDEDTSHKIQHLDSALSKHTTPKDITVYSGTRLDPRDRMFGSSKEVHHPAYLSTSLKPHVAEGFADIIKGKNHKDGDLLEKHILKIDIPKGSHGSYVGKHSYNTDEREFVLPRGAILKHKETKNHIKDSPYGKFNLRIHNMDLIGHKPEEITAKVRKDD